MTLSTTSNARRAMRLQVRGTDGEPVAFMEPSESRWAYGLTRTGRLFGTADTPQLAAAAARDLAEAHQ